ncbi:hypothetical protein HNR22_001792 [Micromonospora jinlongensis]|uniref:DNA-directed RNA polymerase specialized sigma subunit, sigma24 family n=1 Tax=Micromonospora jinlongensis TaxID=1287877 RepID=A0A7Y9X088_9ACTN|nr:hypothetical protein [Micromonospora jinlongensis]NYH42065.1 hypothetical protein [Micromonospora jinlongensis]
MSFAAYNTAVEPKGRAGLMSPRRWSPHNPIADLLEAIEHEYELDSPERRCAEARLTDARLAEQVRFEAGLSEYVRTEIRPGHKWDGVAYHELFDDLWTYALPVIKAFLRTNQLRRVLKRFAPERGVSMLPEDMFLLANSEAARDELALDIISRAVKDFRERAIGQGRWKPWVRGASLRTYFIGACAYEFPRAYKTWSKQHMGQLERLAVTEEIDFDQVGARLTASIADLAVLRVDLQRMINTAQPMTKLILGMIAAGKTQIQIAAELNLTVKAVEGRLSSFRKRVQSAPDYKNTVGAS